MEARGGIRSFVNLSERLKMYEITFADFIVGMHETVESFYLICEISGLIMVDCLLVLFNILPDQLKHIVLDPNCLVVVEEFWKDPEGDQSKVTRA